ncbi:MAG TPA: adenylate kinase [Desulfitobacteriaceae bacterium]|nr:adenylate kinase [Desulfitobacteriaceae bacterium]
MRTIFLGPPGAGKGTQAAAFVEHFNIPHISTGNMFREAIKAGTVIGLKAKKYKYAGSLVPDDLTIRIVQERLNHVDCASGFLLDGFPRNVAQASALDMILRSHEIKLDGVINFEVQEKKLLNRITGRRVCCHCGATYHQLFNPPAKEEICDKCGSELHQRPDDTLETAQNRIRIYNEQTEPLINYYRSQGLITGVQGDQKIDIVLQDILKAVGKVSEVS